MRVLGAAALAALLLAGALPATAGAHSIVRIGGTKVTYLSADATSLNTLTGRVNGGRIELHDPTVDGGIDPGTCDPGDITDDGNAWIIQVFCPRGGIDGLRIDLGEREDTATLDLPVEIELLGGGGADTLSTGGLADSVAGNQGNDRLRTGAGGDELSGGDGDDLLSGEAGADTLEGGLGFDALEGGEGDDVLRSADGLADRVDCGPGNDRVDADTFDGIAPDCEAVARRLVAPPQDSSSSADDRTPPRVEAGGSTLQRLGRGRIKLLATSSERGFLAASGFLEVTGIRLPLQSNRRPVRVGGAGVELTVKLDRRPLRVARRALARGRRVAVRMWAVGTDLAGNSRRARAIRIRLRR
jgi:RTX calcium-binding nonapeptide repeat (4 copies)